MNKIVSFSFAMLMCGWLYAQTDSTLAVLKAKELELQEVMEEMASAPTNEEQLEQCYKFIPEFVNALKTPGSYNYKFDSLKHLSILYAPDNTFRIMTWMAQLMEPDGESFTYRYFGAIQKNNPGELELVGLKDESLKAGSPETLEMTADNWYGAVYYGITQNTGPEGATYYTLFGWDGNNNRSNKKIAEVLYFKDGKAHFGAPIFEIPDDNGGSHLVNRFILEFNENASVSLNYNKERNLIIYDYTSPENKDDKGNYFAYVPDGTYAGFEFKGGLWRPVEKVYHETMESAPVPKPVLSGGRSAEKNSKPKKKKGRKK